MPGETGIPGQEQEPGARTHEPTNGTGGTPPALPRVPDQVVDPAVTRAKFEVEIAAFRAREAEHQQRGWWMLEAAFPTVFVVFVAAQLRPAPVVFGVLLDFSNYDLEPPSVRLVHPFTRVPYRLRELPTQLPRRRTVSIPLGPEGHMAQQIADVPLMVAHDPGDIPFLCVPGVREYHAHPAHTGDSWLLHRGRGSGTLYALLHTIYQYGVQPLRDFAIGLRVVGFQQAEPPA